MKLVIHNHIIDAPLTAIVDHIRCATYNKYFTRVTDKGENLLVTCPHHKDGQEQHPSCQFYNNPEGDLEYGFCHCFTCGYKATLPQVVADCLQISIEDANTWLIDNFSDTFAESVTLLSGIEENKEKTFLPESILQKYDYYHPYMWKRKLSKEIVDRFRVGYDNERCAITFPVYDEHNKLAMITARSVENKKFYIDKGIEKPVYLLNEIINNNIDTCYVCESQINALWMWTIGKPAIALIGTGTHHQYEVIRKSGIRRFILAFDGDEAGDKGIKRFILNMPEYCIIDVLKVPRGKDVNDLSEEEINNLEIYSENALKS